MARDPNRPNPDESVTRQEPAEVPPPDHERSQPKPDTDTGYTSERAPSGDGDIETGRSERGRGNEGIE